MYELINTSVPNGLIAGTHGFATVSMTRGMPDAIRTRVESFCAYPHRTSTHDQTYYTENPVNWFHLMLPGGGHVVGRTAPADFDYTGRTNRIARTLYFSLREMPVNGGAYVLMAEAKRFCESWSGEPRYLPEDKAVETSLRVAGRPNGLQPMHWVKMFGPEGTVYAQRFAVLLSQNLLTGKGIYFKAARSDADGRRLLGLFSDLINLLPTELAVQVTFSTFSACVPNGITCHLKGLYDKNRTFETLSALQPWIDCENCCVMHPELLPHEGLNGKEKDGVAVTSSLESPCTDWCSDVRVRHEQMGRQNRRARIAERPNERVVRARSIGRKNNSSPWTKVVLGVFVAMFSTGALILAIVGKVPGFGRSHRQSALSKMDESPLPVQQGKLGLANSLEGGVTKQKGLDDTLEMHGALNTDHKSKERTLEDSEKGQGEKIAYDGKKAEGEKRKTAETGRGDVVKAPGGKQEEEDKHQQKAEQTSESLLKELLITEVIPSSGMWEDRISDSDKRKLTSGQSIGYFFLVDGNISNVSGCVKQIVKKDPMTKKDIKTLSFEKPDVKSSKWVIVSIPSLHKVYWQWHSTSEPIKLFTKDGSVSLSTIVFGGRNEAFELYQRYQKIVYVLSWGASERPYRYFISHDELSFSHFERAFNRSKPNKVRREREIQSLEREVTSKQQVIQRLQANLDASDGWCAEAKGFISRYEDLKKPRKEAVKEGKKKDADSENLEVQAAPVFSNFHQFSGKIKEKSRKGRNGEKREKVQYVELKTITPEDCDVALKLYKASVQKEIQSHSEKMKSLQAKKETKERDLRDTQEDMRTRCYFVDVLQDLKLPDDVWNGCTESEKKSWKEDKSIDKVVLQNGVGEE